MLDSKIIALFFARSEQAIPALDKNMERSSIAQRRIFWVTCRMLRSV